jgi:hypothetical protein
MELSPRRFSDPEKRYSRRRRRSCRWPTRATARAFSCATSARARTPRPEKQNARRAKTFGDPADLYIDQWGKPNQRSWNGDDNLLRKKVLPRAAF